LKRKRVRVTKEEILDFIREHREILEERYGVKKIGLFGSYAKGTQTEMSDIDFYVVLGKKRLDNMTGLWLYLEKALGEKVDVIYEYPRLRKGLKSQIESEVLYA